MKTSAIFILTAILLLVFSPHIQARDYTIDPTRNCLFLNEKGGPSQEGLKVDLKLNTAYELSLSGDAYFSTERGSDSDPMPGVVVFYSTNQEDGFDSEYAVLRKGEKITFTTPKGDPGNVFLMAFVLDYWPESKNSGTFSLRVQEK